MENKALYKLSQFALFWRLSSQVVGTETDLVHGLGFFVTTVIETSRGELCVSEVLILGSTKVA